MKKEKFSTKFVYLIKNRYQICMMQKFFLEFLRKLESLILGIYLLNLLMNLKIDIKFV